MNMKIQKVVLVSVVVAMASEGGDVQHVKGPENSKWQQLVFNVLGSRLTVGIPTGFDRGFLPPKPEFQVTSPIHVAPEGEPPKEFASFTWGYRGHFWQGRVGGIQFTAFVRRKPNWFLGDWKEMDQYVKMRKENQKRYLADPKNLKNWTTQEFMVTTKGEQQWLSYWFNKDLLRFETWIDGEYLFILQFSLWANGDLKTDWREQAEKLTDRIWQGVRLERDLKTSFPVGPIEQ